jgi:hypothetical protein
VLLQLSLLLLVYAAPSVVNFVGADILRRLGHMLRISLALNARRDQAELIAFALREFSAQFPRVIVAVDINFAALSAATSTDFGVAPIVIWSAAVSAGPAVGDVGAIEGVDNDRGVARPFVNAAAARIRIGTEIADVNEGITLRPDIAGLIDPGADADAEVAAGFRW